MKTILHTLIFSIALFLGLNTASLHGQSVGGANAFLFRPVGIRALSMGGSTTADPVDPTGVAWNPAALGSVSSVQAATAVSLLPYDQHQNFVGAAVPVFKYLTLGGGWINYSVGHIDKRNDFGDPLGSFTSSDNAFLFSLGSAFLQPFGANSSIALGVTGKYISSKIDTRSANGMGIDAGLRVAIGRFSLGGAAQNMGLTLKWDTQSGQEDNVPVALRGGASYDFSLVNSRVLYGLKVGIEAEKLGDMSMGYLGGIEGRMVLPNPRTTIYLRAGYGHDVWTGGFAVELTLDRTSVVGLDYGATQDYLSQTILHHIGLHLIF
jgi:hypothetical protein